MIHQVFALAFAHSTFYPDEAAYYYTLVTSCPAHVGTSTGEYLFKHGITKHFQLKYESVDCRHSTMDRAIPS